MLFKNKALRIQRTFLKRPFPLLPLWKLAHSIRLREIKKCTQLTLKIIAFIISMYSVSAQQSPKNWMVYQWNTALLDYQCSFQQWEWDCNSVRWVVLATTIRSRKSRLLDLCLTSSDARIILLEDLLYCVLAKRPKKPGRMRNCVFQFLLFCLVRMLSALITPNDLVHLRSPHTPTGSGVLFKLSCVRTVHVPSLVLLLLVYGILWARFQLIAWSCEPWS